MALSIEDMTAIKKELDDRYVMQSDCNERQEAISAKFANDDKRIDQTASTLGTFKKLGWIAIGALVGEVVLSLFNLIQGAI